MSNKDETTPTPAAPTQTEIGKDATSAEELAATAEQGIQQEHNLEDDDQTPDPSYEQQDSDDGRGGDDE